jgi:hypothetical protein
MGTPESTQQAKHSSRKAAAEKQQAKTAGERQQTKHSRQNKENSGLPNRNRTVI